MDYDYDIAIVGAGPAGATFARLAAENGNDLRILLIDGQTQNNRKPCGGLLAPDAQKILAYFDLTLPKSVLVDPQIFSVKTIDVVSGLIRYYPRHYLNMDRFAFDKWLLSLVPASVEILSGRCTEANRLAEGFSLKISAAEGKREVSARYIVGADGAGSMVRRSFFQKKIKQYIAIQQWFESHDHNPFYSCIFDGETSESCSWSINKNGYFIFGGCFEPEGGREAFETQKRRLAEKYNFAFGEPVRTEACTALSPHRMGDFTTGRDGVYLVGEAAGFISPSSFEGISGAILSGSLLARAFAEERTEKDISKKYRRLTLSLRLKLRLKVIKRWFMYTAFSRKLIMQSRLQSITPLLRK